jgi:hypothetical protein
VYSNNKRKLHKTNITPTKNICCDCSLYDIHHNNKTLSIVRAFLYLFNQQIY